MKPKMMFILAFAVLVVPAISFATNPHDATSPMKYFDEGTTIPQTFNLITPKASWRAAETPWCPANHQTAKPRKYDHIHTTTSIPFTDTGRTPNVTVTAAMVNAYWDDSFGEEWTPSGSPTNTHNCHGYAMDQTTPLIRSTTNGVGRFRPDAGYTSIDEPVKDCIHSTTSHSYKIEDVYCKASTDTVKVRSDKSNESRIYTITYDPPGVLTTTDLYDD